MRFEFISAHAPKKPAPADGVNTFPVDYLCRKLGVSRAGYYAWKNRGPSKRERDDITLSTKIRAIFDAHHGRYGVRRIFADLRRQGVRVAYKRVQRLMAQLGLVSVHPRAPQAHHDRPGRRALVAARPRQRVHQPRLRRVLQEKQDQELGRADQYMF
ncbi:MULTISPECIES: IS3 family transposase [unclassified Frankia]